MQLKDSDQSHHLVILGMQICIFHDVMLRIDMPVSKYCILSSKSNIEHNRDVEENILWKYFMIQTDLFMVGKLC